MLAAIMAATWFVMREIEQSWDSPALGFAFLYFVASSGAFLSVALELYIMKASKMLSGAFCLVLGCLGILYVLILSVIFDMGADGPVKTVMIVSFAAGVFLNIRNYFFSR